MVRALIVDDEPLARKVIQEYLQDFPEIEVIGECRDGRQAVKAINELKPDLVFLDIRMPVMDGFEVIEHLKAVPHIIFSTAHHDYALKAFEVNAVDYLLKPYDSKRFAKAVQRIMKQQTKPAEEFDRLVRLLQQVQSPQVNPDRIFVRVGKRIVAVHTCDIFWIEADGDYAKLHTTKGTYTCNLSLSALEKRLDSARFIRVHRSSIIAGDSVEHLVSDGEGGYLATLKNKVEIRVSRTYAGSVRMLVW